MPDLVSLVRCTRYGTRQPGTARNLLVLGRAGHVRKTWHCTYANGGEPSWADGPSHPDDLWADLPRPSSVVSLEDIETVLDGALAYALTALADDGTNKAEKMEGAVARILTALGGGEQ